MSTIKFNEHGRRIGDSHPLAKLTDSDVDRIREMREAGMTYGEIARKMDIGKSTVFDICTFRRRSYFAVKVIIR